MTREDIFNDHVGLGAVWEWLNDAAQHPTPWTTIEALVLSVGARGIDALDEPANVERLSRCDEEAREQIKNRIVKLGLVEHA